MTRPRWAGRWLVAYGLAVAINLIAELTGAGTLFGLALVTLMPLLAAFLVSTRRRVDPGRRSRLLGLTLAALVFSWLGDASGPLFLLKVAFFLAAQAFYIGAFWPFRARSVLSRPWLGGLYVAPIAAMIVLVAIHAESLAIPVVVYGLSLTLMAALSTGVNRSAGMGGVLFVISDSVLALDTFVSSFSLSHAPFLNIATYAAAQALLVVGAVRAAVGPSASRPEGNAQ